MITTINEFLFSNMIFIFSGFSTSSISDFSPNKLLVV